MKAKLHMAGLSGGYSKVRVEFPREIVDRASVKQILVRVFLFVVVLHNFFTCSISLHIVWRCIVTIHVITVVRVLTGVRMC